MKKLAIVISICFLLLMLLFIFKVIPDINKGVELQKEIKTCNFVIPKNITPGVYDIIVDNTGCYVNWGKEGGSFVS